MTKSSQDVQRIAEVLRFAYGLNYEQSGQWMIRRGYVSDMEDYERKLAEPEEG